MGSNEVASVSRDIKSTSPISLTKQSKSLLSVVAIYLITLDKSSFIWYNIYMITKGYTLQSLALSNLYNLLYHIMGSLSRVVVKTESVVVNRLSIKLSIILIVPLLSL